MTAAQTKQEALWRSDFGDDYVERNVVSDAHLAALTKNWSAVLRCMDGAPPQSIFEGGANIGLNLRALRRLTDARFVALEPNAKARARLVADGVVDSRNVLDGLLTGIDLPDDAVDLAFTSGVLIHVHPDNLLQSCSELVRVSRRYVIAIEYFADKPAEIPYRDQTEALFKRDFGGFYLDNFPQLRVLDYGFAWKRLTGLDNLTWWVFEKQPG
ncbi:MAG: methyltransferase domain-containing protein [Maricaulaceae bacterium]|jgi:pseudaminic acid biosynthesis-associated methylase